MKNIHIENSYNIWNISKMKEILIEKVSDVSSELPEIFLNRTYKSMYIEWILHNIGYYLSLPFTNKDYFKKINNRCKHVDLQEWK